MTGRCEGEDLKAIRDMCFQLDAFFQPVGQPSAAPMEGHVEAPATGPSGQGEPGDLAHSNSGVVKVSYACPRKRLAQEFI